MPIYMDRHDLNSVTARDVAEAHREDLKIQDQFQCKGLTYWFDEERGTAFCLIEAPNENCVKEMHDHAHGLVPHQIIEVDKNVVNAFLGRIEDPKSRQTLEDTNIPIIDESAFRIILYTGIKDFEIIRFKQLGSEIDKVIENNHILLKENLQKHNGSIVKQSDVRSIISFVSVSDAINFALEFQEKTLNSIKTFSHYPYNISTGISAGSPVTDEQDLFGETVRWAKLLQKIANKSQILLSSQIIEIYNNDNLNGLMNHPGIRYFSSLDEKLLARINNYTESKWNDPSFDVGKFGRMLGLSRSQLYRKISFLTGLSPNDFIREYRLQKALKMLSKKDSNITQIAFEIGINSPSYFSKCFKNRFGILPSEVWKGYN